jgi:hypothetical protein
MLALLLFLAGCLRDHTAAAAAASEKDATPIADRPR